MPRRATHMLTTGAGFVAFDAYRDLFADAAGNVSGPATVIAGFHTELRF